MLPKAIQAQVDAADAMVEGFNSAAPANADTQVPPEPQHVDPPQPEVHIPQGEPVQQSKPENWEARFHTLQGKYNAEVPRLRAQQATYSRW